LVIVIYLDNLSRIKSCNIKKIAKGFNLYADYQSMTKALIKALEDLINNLGLGKTSNE